MSVSRGISPLADGTTCPEDAHDAAPDATWRVAPAHQWIASTAARVAPDGYSWMQAVHWIHSAGHHPRFNLTTVRVAQVLAEHTPCHPGVALLMRRCDLSERMVQYHLAALRETGLIAYIVKGSRRRGDTALASEFARVIPPIFDEALGIRCTAGGPDRRMIGIGEKGRKLIAKLGRKAAQKVRKPRRKRVAHCTPIEGGTDTSSSCGTTLVPSEAQLASGQRIITTPDSQTPQRPKKRLNAIGRRYQLARELIEQVPWLGRASAPRIAWVVREVADAGWTATEVVFWLELNVPAETVHRPSGFLAARLRGAAACWDTPAKRAEGVEAGRDCRRAIRARHDELDSTWQPPSARVADLVHTALTEALHPAVADEDILFEITPDTTIGVDDLTRDEVLQMRAAATADHSLVGDLIRQFGEADTRRLLTNRLVDTAQRLQGASTLMAVHRTGAVHV